jgi:hypothetical protein
VATSRSTADCARRGSLISFRVMRSCSTWTLDEDRLAEEAALFLIAAPVELFGPVSSWRLAGFGESGAVSELVAGDTEPFGEVAAFMLDLSEPLLDLRSGIEVSAARSMRLDSCASSARNGVVSCCSSRREADSSSARVSAMWAQVSARARIAGQSRRPPKQLVT